MSEPKPINCEEALRLLAAFLDGDLRPGTRESIERHLDMCRSCFSRAEFERRLKGELGRLGREEISPTFERRVRQLLASFATISTGEPADGSR
jgi:anti-sigma factor (TIGR02949 family)